MAHTKLRKIYIVKHPTTYIMCPCSINKSMDSNQVLSWMITDLGHIYGVTGRCKTGYMKCKQSAKTSEFSGSWQEFSVIKNLDIQGLLYKSLYIKERGYVSNKFKTVEMEKNRWDLKNPTKY